MPNVKVVILNWNGREHLLRFLPWVISTTPAHIGVVVADNGSDDDSVELLERQFPEVQLIKFDVNHGYAAGYNLALSVLDADYYILLNSDVETTPGWTEPLIDAMEKEPGLIAVAPKILSYGQKDYFEYAGASGGFIDIFGYPFCRGRILSRIEKDSGQYDNPRHTFWASGACLACRKELFTEIGGFDGDFFAHMEEIDLCWRAQLFGHKVGVVPQSVVYHVGGGTLPNNSPFKIYLNYRNSLAMLYKNLSRSNFAIILPFRIVLDVMSSLVFLVQGRGDFFRKIYKAHHDFFRWRNKGLKDKRREIQSRAVSKPEGVYFNSIILRYFFWRKKFGKLL